jgi:GTP-binding protein
LNGGPGKGKNKFGKDAPDLFIDVPLGTIIEDLETGALLADLIHDNQEILLLPGGKGGKGNKHFTTPTSRAPRFAQPGLPGQEKKMRLLLKFLADIGLIGLPNAGKSTLLSRLTMARPKIDSYPFTTLIPNLGVMTIDEGTSMVIADIPGLVAGASAGQGLGLRFLKHIERTRLLLHLLDITHPSPDDILADFHEVWREIGIFNPELRRKPQVVLINKVDLRGPEYRSVGALKSALAKIGIASFAVSALTGEGLEDVRQMILNEWVDGQGADSES